MNLPRSGVTDFRRIAQRLRTYHARARLTLHRGYANLEWAGRAVPLHAPHRRSPIGARRRDLASSTGAEHSPGTRRRQGEAHCRTLDGTSGFVHHQHRHSAGRARANRVRGAVALGHPNRQNGRSIRPPSQGRRQNGPKGLGYRFSDHVNEVRRAPTFSPLPFKSRESRCNPLNSHPAKNA